MTPLDPALLAEVLRCPDEDAPRLVLADWLEERGQDERAEFIRVQCELAKHGVAFRVQEGERLVLSDGRVFDGPALLDHTGHDVSALRRREDELRPRVTGVWPWPFVSEGGIDRTYRRGFIEAVTLTAADWLAHADALTAAYPLREVTLTTLPEFTSKVPSSVVMWAFGKTGELLPGRKWWSYEDLGRVTGKNTLHHNWQELILLILAAEWPGVRFTLIDVVQAKAKSIQQWAGYDYGTD